MGHFDRREITERFIRYAEIFTQSAEGVADTPSTACQRDLARLLYQELLAMGAADVVYDEDKCYVYATIPGNLPVDAAALAARDDKDRKHRENLAPIIGLMAHMDTSDGVDGTGHGVHPCVIEQYDGREITLDAESGISMSPADHPALAGKEGQTLIVTDGHSVLGGDDKAGVTEIMEAAQFYLQHPEIAHPTFRICFTPDEEVGNGILNINLDEFAVDYGYTVDGSYVGEIEYENFNAASAHVTIHGRSTHPGDAKGRMINALLVAMEYNALLPQRETPFYTEGYEGFYHLENMHGACDQAEMDYILRDHDLDKLTDKKLWIEQAARQINGIYGEGTVTIEVKDSYYNMADKVRPHMHLVTNATESMRELGITPRTQPIRGGTDGCQLSFRGVPCPNLGNGAYQYHSRYEFVVVEEMMQGAEVLIRILNKYAGFTLD